MKKKKKTVAGLGHNDLLPAYLPYFCHNITTSGQAEQNLVTFNQNDLQMESFQIYVTGNPRWPSAAVAKIAKT
ncbi:MAG: hypothetical protein AB2705_22550 [Candidatus Thiodiazotropha sp.]